MTATAIRHASNGAKKSRNIVIPVRSLSGVSPSGMSAPSPRCMPLNVCLCHASAKVSTIAGQDTSPDQHTTSRAWRYRSFVPSTKPPPNHATSATSSVRMGQKIACWPTTIQRAVGPVKNAIILSICACSMRPAETASFHASCIMGTVTWSKHSAWRPAHSTRLASSGGSHWPCSTRSSHAVAGRAKMRTARAIGDRRTGGERTGTVGSALDMDGSTAPRGVDSGRSR